MPYTHALTPMTIGAYRFALVLPNLVVGILPMLVGLVVMNGHLYLLGAALVLGGLGDAVILWRIRTYSPGTLVVDHPKLPGCIVYVSDGQR